MSVQFGDEFRDAPRAFQTEKEPFMVRLLIKYSGGVIKNEKQAGYVLVGVVLVSIILAFLFFTSGSDPSAPIRLPVEPL